MASEHQHSQEHNIRNKSISSEDDTRNPTTNKKLKQHPMQFTRNNPYKYYLRGNNKRCNQQKKYYSLQNSLQRLQNRKQQYVKVGAFNNLSKVNQKIKRLMNNLAKSEMDRVKRSQSREKQSIERAHQAEMKHFKRVWAHYFQSLKDKEIYIVKTFKSSQQQDVYQAKCRLISKSRRMRSKSYQLIQLEKKQKYLLKKQQFQELQEINKLKKKVVQKIRKQRQTLFSQWKKIQQEQLTNAQTKKYANLLSRLQQNRSDKEKLYMRQQRRLKQKYQNVSRQLQHEQKMQMNHILWRISLCVQ